VTVTRPAAVLLLFAAMASPSRAESPPPDRPDTTAEVKDFLQRGIAATRRGDYGVAYNFFRHANDLAPSVSTLSQLGLSENSLKKWADGEMHLTAALRLLQGFSSNGPLRPALESALDDARKHVGTLHIVGTPGATVTIDERLEVRLPSEEALRLSEGERHLVASAPGFEPQILVVKIVGEHEFKATFELRRAVTEPARVAQDFTPPVLSIKQTATPPSVLGTVLGVGLGCVGAGTATYGALLLRYNHDFATGGIVLGGGLAAMSIGLYMYWHSLDHDRPAVAVAIGPGTLVVGGAFR
jgi:hypothetical protein